MMETIDGKTYLSVPEYAAMAGVSRSTAYRRLHDPDLCQYVETRDGHVCVDAAALKAGDNVSEKHHDTSHSEPQETQRDTSTDALIALLRDQLATKDAEITRLHALLDQAHQLAAMSQTKELEAPKKRRRWRK